MIARLLLRLAVWLNGGCPCPACVARRQLEARVRAMRGAVPRRQRRDAFRDSWRIGR